MWATTGTQHRGPDDGKNSCYGKVVGKDRAVEMGKRWPMMSSSIAHPYRPTELKAGELGATCKSFTHYGSRCGAFAKMQDKICFHSQKKEKPYGEMSFFLGPLSLCTQRRVCIYMDK